MKNDGWTDIAYNFGDDKALNEQLSQILNEAVHVFRHHADGHWKQNYKPKYVALLAEHLRRRPSLIRKLLKLKDPVVSNITHAAVEMVKGDGKQGTDYRTHASAPAHTPDDTALSGGRSK